MAKRICSCGTEIPEARLKALPDTETCVECSEVKPIKGVMIYDHKTAPTLELGDNLLQYQRRGFHAQLPFNSVNNTRLVQSVAAAKLHREAADLVRGTPDPEDSLEYEPIHFEPSRCHADRPRATPDGHCLECAAAWYKVRR